MNTPQLPLHVQLMQMSTGHWLSQSIYVAAKLGVADHLVTGEKNATELAELTESDPTALYRILRTLASVGIFSETKPQTFALTPLAELLRSDHPRSQRSMSIMLGDPEHYRPWGEILHSVKTGQPAFDHHFGKNVFEYYGEHPEAAKIFEESMNSFSMNEEPAILAAYDFSRFQTVVDVGGGYGELLGTILEKTPSLHGILFDEAYVTDHAAATLNKHNVGDRCRVVSGNFFDAVPVGGDAYLMKHIVHDWGDAQAIAILKNCAKVLPDHGKIIICELVVPPANQPSAAKMLDINMLVMCPGGKERTAKEFEQLFTAAGLKLDQIVTTAEDICVIETSKA